MDLLNLNLSAEDRVNKTRMELMKDHRLKFYGAISYFLPWLKKDNQPTCYATFDHYGFNSDFINSLTDEELRGVICHEIEHICRQHLHRFDFSNKDTKVKANISCDDVINKSLRKNNIALPKECVILDDKYNGMSEEEIFYTLPDEEVPSGYECDLVDGGEGQARKGDSEQQKKDKKFFESIMAKARECDSYSLLPDNISQILSEEAKIGKINWADKLKLKLEPVFARNNSWSTPKRKLIHQGLYVPGKRKEGVGDLAVFIDTSGSMSLESVLQILGEYKGIFEDVRPRKLHLVFFHTSVYRYEIMEPYGELPTVNSIESGGTDFREAMKFLLEQDANPAACVFMTDGYSLFPPQPDFPVFWCSCAVTDFPYGTYIPLELT